MPVKQGQAIDSVSAIGFGAMGRCRNWDTGCSLNWDTADILLGKWRVRLGKWRVPRPCSCPSLVPALTVCMLIVCMLIVCMLIVCMLIVCMLIVCMLIVCMLIVFPSRQAHKTWQAQRDLPRESPRSLGAHSTPCQWRS